jgi:hypothetical protein
MTLGKYTDGADSFIAKAGMDFRLFRYGFRV